LSLIAAPLPACWGVDCEQKLRPADAQRLSVANYNGQRIAFVWRYVFFGQPMRGDIDVIEAQAIADAGLTLLIVQHPRNPGWLASPSRGTEDGKWAAANARNAGYPPGAYIALDLEGLGNPGQMVIELAEAWCEPVKDAGYGCCVYVGFDCGMTAAQLYALRNVDRYWSDAGGRSVDTRGVCMRQHTQTILAGVQVDPDEHFADKLGGLLVGAASGAARDTIPDAAEVT
jgi:hypothetical protein